MTTNEVELAAERVGRTLRKVLLETNLTDSQAREVLRLVERDTLGLKKKRRHQLRTGQATILKFVLPSSN